MGGVSAFLESSTIHGLNYISTTRKYVRVFWMLVVLAGFIGAGYMIQTSFQSWADSPIKTTVETLPISELKFPKVTVCPPKNTYTDLNYDLMIAENFTLTEKMREELVAYSRKVRDDHIYMDELDFLLEEDRYYNWYYGYSRMERPTVIKNKFTYILKTSALSGVVTTQYFDEQYQLNLLKRRVNYEVHIYPPKSVRNNSNVTLHLNLEKISITGLSYGRDNTRLGGRHLEEWLTSAAFNFTPPVGTEKDYRNISYNRDDIKTDHFKKIKMDKMPGFRLSWIYSGLEDNITPDSKYSNANIKKPTKSTLTQLFIQ